MLKRRRRIQKIIKALQLKNRQKTNHKQQLQHLKLEEDSHSKEQ